MIKKKSLKSSFGGININNVVMSYCNYDVGKTQMCMMIYVLKQQGAEVFGKRLPARRRRGTSVIEVLSSSKYLSNRVVEAEMHLLRVTIALDEFTNIHCDAENDFTITLSVCLYTI